MWRDHHLLWGCILGIVGLRSGHAERSLQWGIVRGGRVIWWRKSVTHVNIIISDDGNMFVGRRTVCETSRYSNRATCEVDWFSDFERSKTVL